MNAPSIIAQGGINTGHKVIDVCGIASSVFTTAGAVVPTARIQTIALRTADHIKKNAHTVLA